MNDEKKLTNDVRTFVALFVEFDEMGFSPTTTCPNPEEYARDWKMAMLNKVHLLQRENKRLTEEKDELQKQVDELKERYLEESKERCKFEQLYGKIRHEHNIGLGVQRKHWEKKVQQVVKDTAKKILTELDLFFNGATFRKGYEFKDLQEICDTANHYNEEFFGLDQRLTFWKGKSETIRKETAEKFASLVEFHSVSTIDENGIEQFSISALGVKEILHEEFGIPYDEICKEITESK